MFAREAASNETILNVLSDAVLFKVDCEKGEGVELAEKFSIRAYPTYFALNGKGETVAGWVGYGGAEMWSSSVTAAKNDRRTIDLKRAAFETGPTAELAVALANTAATDSDLKGAVTYFAKARELDPAGSLRYTTEILGFMAWGARAGIFTFDEARAEVDLILATDAAEPGDRVSAISMLADMGRGTDRADDVVPYLMSGLAAVDQIPVEDQGREVAGLRIQHALLVEQDETKAVQLRKDSLPEGWQEHAGRLNYFAWWCFENDVNLVEAHTLALRGVELAEEDGEKANILDTAAEICNALGNCDEAVALIERAIEMAPDNEQLQEQLTRFRAAAEEKKS